MGPSVKSLLNLFHPLFFLSLGQVNSMLLWAAFCFPPSVFLQTDVSGLASTLSINQFKNNKCGIFSRMVCIPYVWLEKVLLICILFSFYVWYVFLCLFFFIINLQPYKALNTLNFVLAFLYSLHLVLISVQLSIHISLSSSSSLSLVKKIFKNYRLLFVA